MDSCSRLAGGRAVLVAPVPQIQGCVTCELEARAGATGGPSRCQGGPCWICWTAWPRHAEGDRGRAGVWQAQEPPVTCQQTCQWAVPPQAGDWLPWPIPDTFTRKSISVHTHLVTGLVWLGGIWLIRGCRYCNSDRLHSCHLSLPCTSSCSPRSWLRIQQQWGWSTAGHRPGLPAISWSLPTPSGHVALADLPCTERWLCPHLGQTGWRWSPPCTYSQCHKFPVTRPLPLAAQTFLAGTVHLARVERDQQASIVHWSLEVTLSSLI